MSSNLRVADTPAGQLGETLFGRAIRLPVCLWVLEHTGVFNQSEAAGGIGYRSTGEVAKELERLVELGMVRKFGRPGKVGPQNYVRVPHGAWSIIAAAGAYLASQGEPDEQAAAASTSELREV